MKKITITIGLAFICMVYGCKDTCDDCTPINANLKLFLFEPGSYWIYEDDTTGVRDTVTLLEAEHSCYPPIVYGKKPDGGCYETYFMKYKKGIDIYEETAFSVEIFRGGSLQFYSGEASFVYADQYYSTNTYAYQALHTSMVISNKTFYNVRQCVNLDTINCTFCVPQNTISYYAPFVGLVKQVTPSPNGFVSKHLDDYKVTIAKI